MARPFNLTQCVVLRLPDPHRNDHRARRRISAGRGPGVNWLIAFASYGRSGRSSRGFWKAKGCSTALLNRGDIGATGNMELCEMAESGGLSWEAQEVFQKIKSFGRLPGSGVPMIQLNMRVGSAKTVKKGIPELKSAGLITDTTSGEPTLTDKGHKTSV
jgi:hypothetical protein